MKKLVVILVIVLSMSRVSAEPDPFVTDCLHLDQTYYTVQEFACGLSACRRSGVNYQVSPFTKIASGRYVWDNTHYRFDVPSDVHPAFMYRFVSRRSSDRYLWLYISVSTPSIVYVTPYQTMREYADRNGQHYGPHPCGAYEISRVVWKSALQRVS